MDNILPHADRATTAPEIPDHGFEFSKIVSPTFTTAEFKSMLGGHVSPQTLAFVDNNFGTPSFEGDLSGGNGMYRSGPIDSRDGDKTDRPVVPHHFLTLTPASPEFHEASKKPNIDDRGDWYLMPGVGEE